MPVHAELRGERRLLGWTVAVGSMLFGLALSLYLRPEFGRLLLFGLILLCLVVLLGGSLIAGWWTWLKSRRVRPLPAIVCLASIFCSSYVASPAAQYISDRIFERHLGDYTRVADDFRAGKLNCAKLCDGRLAEVKTTSLPAHVGSIWAAHCHDGGSVLLFLHGTDVPLLHEGYMMNDSREESDCTKLVGAHESGKYHLPYLRQITGSWYRFSDQPGF